MERSLTPYFLAVRELVNAADHYDLLSLGAPVDEYDSQVGLLVKWRDPVTTAQVQAAFADMAAEQAGRLAAAIEAVRPRR